MTKTIFAAAIVIALSTVGALAQSSQSQGGAQAGTNGNSDTTKNGMMNNGAMNNGGMSSTTSGMSNSGTSEGMAKDKDGMAKNPSSSGNVGPGTTPGNTSK